LSIYVCIGSVIDHELEDTIDDILNNADNPEQIYVGIALTCRQDELLEEFTKWADPIINKFSENKRVQFKKYIGKEHDGLANARINAASMYNDEDYFLQIDAHTMLLKGWDTQLVELYNLAVQDTGTDKTILTAYLGMYCLDENKKRKVIDSRPQYPVQYPGLRNIYGVGLDGKKISLSYNVPFLQAEPISFFPDELNKTRPILPSIKSNGQFIFGNKHYAKNINLPSYVIFWEEDPIQSINLFDDGFALAYPNVEEVKVLHFYVDHVDEKTKREQPVIIQKDNILKMKYNFLNYLNNPENQGKINKWQDWSKINLNGKTEKNYYIPDTYR
jgi:hypothetical protein